VAARSRIYDRQGIRNLVSVMSGLGLSSAAAGQLFGVQRQAVIAWLREGVPQNRVAEVACVAQATAALRSFFEPERLPTIVRSAMPDLGQRSVLETIATRGPDPSFGSSKPGVVERANARQKKRAALLGELRRARQLTQETLAETLGMSQPEVSKVEHRTDLYVSTLRRYVEAMGGELQIFARFPNGEVEIIQIAPEVAGHKLAHV
jgi:predicted transcriptional regulator